VREGGEGEGPGAASGIINITRKQGRADVDIAGWAGPLVRVDLAFRPWGAEQAGVIQRYFGEDGHRLVGDNVSLEGNRKLLALDTVLRLPMRREYQGTGNAVVGPFSLRPGVVTLDLNHSGPTDFQARFSGPHTNTLESPAPLTPFAGTGGYQGERAFAITPGEDGALEPGEYQLEVDAAGPWVVALAQEFPNGGFVFPLKAEDTGDAVIRWFRLEEGEHRLQATHTGSGDFVVELLNADAGHHRRLLESSGAFQGTADIRITDEPGQRLPPGIYALAVRADGHWTLSVE
jgi:hypothetical protein